MLALGCLVAAVSAIFLDWTNGTIVVALLLFASAAGLASPIAALSWVPPLAARLFVRAPAAPEPVANDPPAAPEPVADDPPAAPEPVEAVTAVTAVPPLAPATWRERWRRRLPPWTALLPGLALAAPAAAVAAVRLAPGFPSPEPWILPVSLLAALVAAVPPTVVAWRGDAPRSGPRAWIPLLAASLLVSALFVVTHFGEGTFYGLRASTILLHVALFGGTLLASSVLVALLGIAADDAKVASLSVRWRVALAALALGSGAAWMFADRRLLVGLYPYAHRWLTLHGLANVAAGAALLAPAKLRKRASLARAVSSAIVVAGALATVLFARSAGPSMRSELKAAPVGRTLLRLLGPLRGKAPSATSHPLLAVDQMLKEPGPRRDFNVLLITADALRNDQLDAGMPSMSRLAADSVRFRRAYTQGTRTVVASGALMMGRYSADVDWKLMMYSGGKLMDPKAMSDDDVEALQGRLVYATFPSAEGPPMLAERLRQKGIFTMAAPYARDNNVFHKGGAFDRGWDVFEDMAERKWKPPTSANVAAAAVRQLRRSTDKRWFQWVHFYDPHEAKGERDRYEPMVRSFDAALGRVLDELSNRGLWDDTVVILSADHGEALGEHGHQGHATSLYEEQARVPLLIRTPGVPARTVDVPVALIDVTATIAVAMGADTTGFDGVNLWPLILSDKYPARRPVFVELHRYYSNSGQPTQDMKGVVLDDYKLIMDRVEDTEQLFSLKDDPAEARDVIGKEPARAAELQAVLDAFLYKAEAEHPMP